ncbi:hypothetical protein ABIB68_008227 [Bradyrhizobium sp. F1.2.2]
MHRQRLAVDLKAWESFDCRSAIAQTERDIAAIDTGLERFSGLRPIRLAGQPGGGERASEGKCCDLSSRLPSHWFGDPRPRSA